MENQSSANFNQSSNNTQESLNMSNNASDSLTIPNKTPSKMKKVHSHQNMSGMDSNKKQDTIEINNNGSDDGLTGSHDRATKNLFYDIESKHSQKLNNVPLRGNLVVNYRNYILSKDHNKNILKKDVTNVLVICTGGTFCMVKTDRGYMVQKGLGERLKSYHSFYDRDYAAQIGLRKDELVTPETPYKKRIRFTMLEFEELIDSSNMMISDWVKISQTIEQNYKDYDGFVILHGTDTMAYTASALSFMLENLNKSVVVTGSQIPLSELKNDAVDNLLGSLLVAGHFQISEVMIFFANKLLRGNRTQKESTSDMSAFTSPNFPALGTFGVDFDMNWDQTHRFMFEGKMQAFTNMSNNISLLSISPLFNCRVIESILDKSQAVIIQAYGMGNIPNKSKELLDLIKKAIEKDVIVVILTQCHKGGVNDLYEAGRSLTELGAVLGQDMTLESCYAKLSYLLGKDYTIDKIKKMLSKSLRGELTDIKREEKMFSLKNSKLVEAIAKVLKSDEASDYKLIANTLEPVLVNSIASTGDIEQLKRLKEQAVNFNTVDYRSRSALHVACLKGHLDVVKFLIKENVNLDKIDATGCSPLYHSIRKGQGDIAYLLYFKGASVHSPPEKLAKLLCICGFKGETSVVKLLHDCEAKIETSDYDLRSVAHLAAAEGHTELLLYLINETNFNFDIKDRWGKKPLEEISDPRIRQEFEDALQKRSFKKRRGSSQGRDKHGSIVTTNFKSGQIEADLLKGMIDTDKEELIQLVNQQKIGKKNIVAEHNNQ